MIIVVTATLIVAFWVWSYVDDFTTFIGSTESKYSISRVRNVMSKNFLTNVFDDDRKFVSRWFIEQASQWEHVVQRCPTIAVLFSDDEWWPFTRELINDINRFPYKSRNCFAVWYWSKDTSKMPDIATPFYIDTRDDLWRAREWGSKEYFDKIAHRLPIMLAIMEKLGTPHYSERGLLLLDSDIALQRNLLARLPPKNDSILFVAQQEVPCSGKTCVNGGIWWLRLCAKSRQLLIDTLSTELVLGVTDQDALSTIVAKPYYRTQVMLLNTLKYANGFTYHKNDAWSARHSRLVHANWSGNLTQKMETLQEIRRKTHCYVGAPKWK